MQSNKPGQRAGAGGAAQARKFRTAGCGCTIIGVVCAFFAMPTAAERGDTPPIAEESQEGAEYASDGELVSTAANTEERSHCDVQQCWIGLEWSSATSTVGPKGSGR